MRRSCGGGGGLCPALLLCLTLSLLALPSKGECGFPGTPADGFIRSPKTLPSNNLWMEGDDVTYGCHAGFVLFGDLTRVCLDNGTWSGEVPTCDLNLALDGKATLSDTLADYNASLAVDGSLDTCAFTPRNAENRWLRVHLGKSRAVAAVAVTISAAGYVHKFTVLIVHIGSSEKMTSEVCGTFDGVYETNTVVVVCNEGRPLLGHLVVIRDDRSVLDYFGICEVEIFQGRDEHRCGEPQAPSYGDTVVIDPHGFVEFSCWRGRRLVGDASHVCIEGRWIGAVPFCLEVTCDSPTEVPNGVVHVMTPYEDIVVGAVANLTCDEGFLLLGNGTRVCGQDGRWMGPEPSCELVDCGLPSRLANGVIRVNSTSWKAVGVVTCLEGFLFVGDEQLVHCGADGRWHAGNISCQEVFVAMGTENTEPLNSTGLIVDIVQESVAGPVTMVSHTGTDDIFPTGVLVGSIVGVIAVVMFIFLIAFLRRRWCWRSSKQPSSKGNDIMRDGMGGAYLVEDEPVYDDIYTNGGYRSADPLYADTAAASTATASSGQPIYDQPEDPIYYTPVEFPKGEARSSATDGYRGEENPVYECLDPCQLEGAVYAQVDLQKKKKDREESFRRRKESQDSDLGVEGGEEGEDRVYENVELGVTSEHRPLPPIPSETSLVAMETLDNDLYSPVTPDEPQDDDSWEKSDSIYAAIDVNPNT